MAEYIDKQELLKNFCGYDLTKCVKYGNETPEQQNQSYNTMMMYEIAMEIEGTPAADVAPVRHGQWEVASDGDIQCSNCNMIFTGQEIFPGNFCPCCGAKMDLKDGDNNDF